MDVKLSGEFLVSHFDQGDIPCTRSRGCAPKITDLSQSAQAHIKSFSAKIPQIFSSYSSCIPQTHDPLFTHQFICPQSWYRFDRSNLSICRSALFGSILFTFQDMPSPGTQGNRPKTTLNCSTRFDDANRFYCKLTSDKSSLYEITIDRNHCTESRTGRLDGLDQTSYQASCDPQFPVLEEFLSPSPSSSAPSSAIFSGKSGSFPFLKVAAAALAVFCSYQAFRASKAAKGDANEKSAQERDDAQKRARLYGAAAAASFVAILFV